MLFSCLCSALLSSCSAVLHKQPLSLSLPLPFPLHLLRDSLRSYVDSWISTSGQRLMDLHFCFELLNGVEMERKNLLKVFSQRERTIVIWENASRKIQQNVNGNGKFCRLKAILIHASNNRLITGKRVLT